LHDRDVRNKDRDGREAGGIPARIPLLEASSRERKARGVNIALELT